MNVLTSAFGLSQALAIGALSLAVGVGIGRMTQSSPDPASAASGSPITSELSTNRISLPASTEPSPVKEQGAKKPTRDDLQKILADSDPRSRSGELDSLLAGADVAEVRQLLDWVESMPDSPAKRAAEAKVMQKWGELDGVSAAAYGVDAFQQTGNSTLLRNALLGWAQSDPSSTMQYLQGLGLGRGLANDFSRDILGVWSNLNPQAASAYIQANPSLAGGGWNGFGGRGGGGSAIGVVAGNWAMQDPRAAAAWAQSLPAGPQQGSAMNQVLQGWVAQDPAGAAAYVNSQQAGPARDGMVSSLARGLAADDPASAMKWVSSISNQGMQMGTAMGVLGQAGVYGPNGPDLTLAQSLLSPLPQTAQTQVMQRLTNGGGRWGGGH